MYCLKLMSNTSPGSRALEGQIEPAPKSNAVAGDNLFFLCARIGAPEWSVTFAVVIIAEVMAAGLQSGCFCLISAAMPATWGVAMLVPDNNAKLCPGTGSKHQTCPGLHAAHINEPGAMMFGFSTSAVSNSALFTSGPLDEYDATTGACWVYTACLPSEILAVALNPRALPLLLRIVFEL